MTIARIALMITVLTVLSGCGWRPQNIEELEPEIIQDVVTYNIQVGLFDSQNEAESTAISVRSMVTDSVRVVYKPPFYRVWVETHLAEDEVDRLIGRLRRDGFSEARRIFDEDEY